MGVQMEPFIQESLRIIKRASEDNKLVVVVGAGVSMLSHFPSWKEVIDQFAGPFSEQKDSNSVLIAFCKSFLVSNANISK